MKRKSFLGLSLATILTFITVMPVYATTGPGQPENPIPNGVTEEQWNKLNDKTIEFEELPYLIRYFNPNMLNTVDGIYSNIDNMQYTYDQVKGYIRDLESQLDNLEDSGEINTEDGMAQYQDLYMTSMRMKKIAGGTKKGIDLMERPNSQLNTGINQMNKNLTYYADQIMIGFNSTVSSQAMLEKMVELSSEALEAQKLSLQLGTATEADVLSAQKDLLAARSSLLKINSAIDSMRRSLYLMTGYSVEENPEIGGLPQLDLEELSAIDLEADTRKAIGNNYDLIAERHANTNKVTSKTNLKKDAVSEGEQSVTVNMQSFYQSMQQAKTAYQAACVSYEKANIKKYSADLSYQMGKISKLGYLQAQMAFLQAESGKQSAYNTLYQAYNTYQWAINGIIMNAS